MVPTQRHSFHMAKLTSQQAQRAYLIIELLRATGEREFPMQLATTFFWIAAHNGCQQEELTKATGMSASSVSRNVTWLGPRHRLQHRDGLKLIKRERDPDNHRAWRIWLTPKGQLLVNFLENQLEAPMASFEKAQRELLTDIKGDTDDSELDTEDLG